MQSYRPRIYRRVGARRRALNSCPCRGRPEAGELGKAGCSESRAAKSSSRQLIALSLPLEMKGTSAAEGVAVDAKGNVYGGEVGPRQLVKHISGGPAR